MGTEINGLLIVDKPEGVTSLAVVTELKRRFGFRKAGHIGTLDPFATGVLPVAINEGTKLVPFLVEEPKEYEAVLRLGEETATDDLTGEVLHRGGLEEILAETILKAFDAFRGKTRQIPPMFSAIKLHGKPLYRLARKGIEVDRKEREIEVFDIQVMECAIPHVRFRLLCSKGTYVRALARDVGRKLGCGAHLIRLRRLRSGSYDIKGAIPAERLKDLSKAEDLFPWLISLREALARLPEMIGDEYLVKMVRGGRGMAVRDLLACTLPPFEKGEWLKMSAPGDGLVAILKSEVKDSDIRTASPEMIAFRPLRVFRPSNTILGAS